MRPFRVQLSRLEACVAQLDGEQHCTLIAYCALVGTKLPRGASELCDRIQGGPLGIQCAFGPKLERIAVPGHGRRSEGYLQSSLNLFPPSLRYPFFSFVTFSSIFTSLVLAHETFVRMASAWLKASPVCRNLHSQITCACNVAASFPSTIAMLLLIFTELLDDIHN